MKIRKNRNLVQGFFLEPKLNLKHLLHFLVLSLRNQDQNHQLPCLELWHLVSLKRLRYQMWSLRLHYFKVDHPTILCLQVQDKVFLGNLNCRRNLLRTTSSISPLSPHRDYSGVVSRLLHLEETFSEHLSKLVHSLRLSAKLTPRSLLESSR